jgi:hypothetical protein
MRCIYNGGAVFDGDDNNLRKLRLSRRPVLSKFANEDEEATWRAGRQGREFLTEKSAAPRKKAAKDPAWYDN